MTPRLDAFMASLVAASALASGCGIIASVDRELIPGEGGASAVGGFGGAGGMGTDPEGEGDCGAGPCSGQCHDGVINGGETEVDCGGGVCAGCPDGSPCSLASDCLSGICENDRCAARRSP